MTFDVNREVFLTPEELSDRYKGKISTRTLANWRSSGLDGPPYKKVGGRVLYSLNEVEAWEIKRTKGIQSR